MNDKDSGKIVEILNNGFILLSDVLAEINANIEKIIERMDK
jgi:hypothetical protein